MTKLRVMYVLSQFPQVSETYIRSEIEAIRDECELRIFSLVPVDTPYRNHEPYVQIDDPEALARAIREFRPHVIHTHWLKMTREVGFLAGYFGQVVDRMAVPFTVRAHSFDVLGDDYKLVRESAPIINSDLCLGVLTFPFTRPIFRQCGVRDDKVFDCWPVINYGRFHDESPNGPDVMNVGACLPKKHMEDFLELATLVPQRRFHLYAMGYRSREIDKLNAKMGHPVTIIPPVEPELMLPEYKKHQWMVYTASHPINTVGWSLAVAEAQAAGVGVCFPRLRPDLDEYVGPAGYLYESVREVAAIVAKPFPEEKRRLGFEHARKSDVFEHKRILTALWRKAAGDPSIAENVTRHRRSNDGLPEWGLVNTPLEQKWRLRNVAHQVGTVVPGGQTILIAGDTTEWDQTGAFARHRLRPFVEHHGQYWGPPADDATAISELERMRQEGASAILFGESARWWLDHYTGFGQFVRSRFDCRMDNDRVVLFDLQAPRRDPADSFAPAGNRADAPAPAAAA